MKFAYPEISGVFKLGGDYIPTVVIENQRLYRSLLRDICQSIAGMETPAVLSVDNKPIAMAKNAEILTDFINFNLNQKSLLNKVCAAMEEVAVTPEHYMATQELLAEIEHRIDEWTFGFDCNVVVSKISVANLLKAVGVEFSDDYEGESGEVERVLDYMELVREFDRDKMFVTVNMRDFFQDEVIGKFMQTVCAHEFRVLMLEGKARRRLTRERRLIIDEDLCEI